MKKGFYVWVLMVAVAVVAGAYTLVLAETAPKKPVEKKVKGHEHTMDATDGRKESTPKEIEDVGIDEKLDALIPMDAAFTDELGKKVTIGDYFDGKKPVVFTYGYFKCPMLCPLILKGVTDALLQVNMTPGKEFEIITVSIDPRETAASAKLQQQKYIEMYGKPEAAVGWHFLTGDKENIEKLTGAFGFRYAYNPEDDMYNHTAAIMVATPDGKISRYLYGVSYAAKLFRLSLVEATEGKIGTTVDRIVLYCFHYDPNSRSYSPVANNIMKLGGTLTLVFLAVTLGGLWGREKRKKRKLNQADNADSA